MSPDEPERPDPPDQPAPDHALAADVPQEEGPTPTGRTEARVLERSRRSAFADRVTAPVAERLRLDETSGWPVIISALVALVWANLVSPGGYQAFWTTELSLALGGSTLVTSMREVVDSVLLPFFFLMIGIEVREDLARGHLSDVGRAWLPLAAAVGGMAFPVLAYVAVTWDTPYTSGFGVPVATDIAFGLALLMILGRRVPTSLKAFLLAFAAADDVGGVLVIAFFYGHGISFEWLAAALAVAGMTAAVVRLKPQVTWIYAALGGCLWATTALSGVHVTIAGVVFGLMIPIRRLYQPPEVVSRVRDLSAELETAEAEDRERLLGRLQEVTDRSEAPAERFARILRPTVSYVILPIFGLGMAGTSLSGEAWAGLVSHPVALGIMAGLLVGKPLGVLGLSWLAVRAGIATLPTGLGWSHVAGAALLSGIGFTVSLFIAGLAFEPETLEVAKLSVLFSSVLAGGAGLALLAVAGRDRPGDEVAST